MANVVQLNAAKHRDLKIIRERSAEYGDDVMLCMTFPAEFRQAQAHYPILFQKDQAAHNYFAVALFGLEKGENLFLQDKYWDAGYIPLMIERQPFMIGVQKANAESGEEDRRVVHIDLDDKRVSKENGERLFAEAGSNTEYLERIAAILETIHQWNLDSENFMKVIAEYDLFEPVTIDITLNNGTRGQLLDFYTISEEKLSQLSDEVVVMLHKTNYLRAIYMAIASLANIGRMCELKSKKAGTLPEFA